MRKNGQHTKGTVISYGMKQVCMNRRILPAEKKVEKKVEEEERRSREEKAFKTAEVMMRNGESDDKIVLYTGLSLSQVRELRKKLGL